MNKERMERVAEAIEEHDDHFDMGVWMTSEWQQQQPGYEPVSVVEAVKHFDLNECDTAGCVAGWACFLWPEELVDGDTFMAAGQRILGLTEMQATMLFERDGDAAYMAEELRWWTLHDDDFYGVEEDDEDEDEDEDVYDD